MSAATRWRLTPRGEAAVGAPLSARTYTVAQGRGEWVILDGTMGRRVTGFSALTYALLCVVALLEGRFDRA
jgi:hypothetical protein